MEPYKTKSANIEKLYPDSGVSSAFLFHELLNNRDSALLFTTSVAALHGNEEFVKNLHPGGADYCSWRIHLGISAPPRYQDATTASYWNSLQLLAEEKSSGNSSNTEIALPHYERPVDHTPT